MGSGGEIPAELPMRHRGQGRAELKSAEMRSLLVSPLSQKQERRLWGILVEMGVDVRR